MGVREEPQKFSIAVCVPVWGRSDLLRASLASLERALRGLDATVYLFDNGSDRATVRFLEGHRSRHLKIVKIFLPENHGIPYVVNTFRALIAEPCELLKRSPPEFVLLMDADAYFKRPIKPLLHLLNTHYGFAVVSGHDSVEHEAIASHVLRAGSTSISVKEKKNERMLTLLMRREELEVFMPFPTYRDRDVDWEIFYWNKGSLNARRRRMLCADWVLHLGQFDSTWHPSGVPASRRELQSIISKLSELRLLTPARKRISLTQLASNEGLSAHNRMRDAAVKK
jgi:glycosyltransferase involved in cell wall biosynthesis